MSSPSSGPADFIAVHAMTLLGACPAKGEQSCKDEQYGCWTFYEAVGKIFDAGPTSTRVCAALCRTRSWPRHIEDEVTPSRDVTRKFQSAG